MKPQIQPTYKQHLAWQALKEKSEVFFGGGAGGGKSWWLCETRLVMSYFYPGYRSFIAREELKRLMQSTYITWCKVCKFHNIPLDDWRLDGKYNYIEFKNGSRIDLLDIKYMPSDPLYERFGSLEYTDGAIEECGEVHFKAYDILSTRIGRHLNKEHNIPATMAMTGNPKKNWTYTYFYKKHRDGTLGKDIAFIQSLYKDNPYTSTEYGDRLSRIKDPETKARLRDGDWEYDDSPNALVSFENIEDVFSNDFVPEGAMAMTADIAMLGSDKFVIGIWSGFRLIRVISLDKSTGPQVEAMIKSKAIEYNIPRSRIVFDSDGIGNFLEGYLKGAKAFHGGGKTRGIDRNEYGMLKDQCGYFLAERVNKHELYIKDESYREQIIEELEQLQSYKLDDDKKLKILPKIKIKENIGRSPDYLDMLLMRESLELIVATPINVNF